MLTIAIIGTAGRSNDAALLGAASFLGMVQAAQRVTAKIAAGAPWTAVSGGAAWADHVAVVLFLDGVASGLNLQLPARLDAGGFLDTGVLNFRVNPGRTSNYYHEKFAKVSGRNPFVDFQEALKRPGCSMTVLQGFSARNSAVAQADHCIALTFGERALVKSGGTAETMKQFLARRSGRSVHIDLHTFEAFSPARLR
jgi:hypothetical protein